VLACYRQVARSAGAGFMPDATEAAISDKTTNR
jgi:hypothetical protein